jgi:hypothetical protein
MSDSSESLCAFVDESFRLGGEGLYLLAAVTVPEAGRDAARAAMQDLLLPRQKRIHWRDERADRRRRLVEQVTALGSVHLVVVVRGVSPHAQERARRRCLARLLWELDRRSVREVTFEARQPRLNASDLVVVRGLRLAGQVSSQLRLAFERPSVEPLLWVADVVAGAASAALDSGAATTDVAEVAWIDR